MYFYYNLKQHANNMHITIMPVYGYIKNQVWYMVLNINRVYELKRKYKLILY